MLSLELFAGLLSKLPANCSLVLVGDPNQLGSVGTGNLIPELLELGCPVTRLEQQYRQSDNESALFYNVTNFPKLFDSEELKFDDSFKLIPANESDIFKVVQEEAAKRHLAGDAVYDAVCCVDSDPTDCVHMGTTKNGTPVDITRVVAEADFRICTGNIEFHYFAGYSGGAKAIMPGVSTPAAIQANHSLMVSPAACAGNLDTNPLRQDLEEAGRICGIDYIVNVVLDEHKHIVYAVAGDTLEAHRAGCRYLDRMYRKPIPAPADIVIVSQGGAPKDANLYQTQKALDNAKHAVRKGGTIILIGACSEGLGSSKFEQWLTSAPTAHSMIERIGRQFELGGHKAAAIAMVLENAQIDLVSEMPEAFVRSIFLNPQPSAQKALDEAFQKYGPDATVIAMPFGGATLPVVDAAENR